MTACVGTLVGTAHGQAIFREDFEGLTLGPSVEEANARGQVWTHTPPAGWTQDDSKMPGVGNPALDGITEWVGWSFTDKEWWWRYVDNQQRDRFVYGQGTVMVADNDEWDDSVHASGFWDASITTKQIDVSSAAANSLVLVYDSSWRPERLDDGNDDPRIGFPLDPAGYPDSGGKYNDQTGYVTAAFDGGAPKEIQRWTSIADAPTFHDHFPNEVVIIPLNNPAGAKNLRLKFGSEKAANDWWWAVDNIAVGTPPFATAVTNSGVSFSMKIVQTGGKSVNQSKPISLELDGQSVTPVVTTDDAGFLLLSYTQTQVFTPGSRHSLKAKYTSNEGKALEDTISFVASRYIDMLPSPVNLFATITEKEWMTVNESKGVKFSLDGKDITPVTLAVNDGSVTARASLNTPLSAKTSHTLVVSYTTDAGQVLTETVPFVVPDYPTLPASMGTALGTGAQAGMKWRTHRWNSESGRSSPLPTIAEAEALLKGTYGASIHDTMGQGADGYFPIDFVNFDEAALDAGHFKSAAAAPLNVPDQLFPGIPEAADRIAGEALAFVEFPKAGVYTMVVNHDDGFQLTAGTKNNPTQILVGKFDGTGGQRDGTMAVKIDQPGVYFFRMLWYEGNGSSRVEWFTVNPDGSRALVGGTQPGSLKAYRVRTVPEPSTPSGPGSITFSYTNGKLVLTYGGTLQSSGKVTGPFQPVAGAASPYSVTPSGAQQFYISKQQ
jgi:hypothetical protein